MLVGDFFFSGHVFIDSETRKNGCIARVGFRQLQYEVLFLKDSDDRFLTRIANICMEDLYNLKCVPTINDVCKVNYEYLSTKSNLFLRYIVVVYIQNKP